MTTCNLCGGLVKESLLEINSPDRFEKAVSIKENNYVRHWKKCQMCGCAMNVMKPEHERLLDALGSEYYEIDLGNDLYKRFKQVMDLQPEASDNHQRVIRILSFLKKWRPSCINLDILDVGSGLGVFPARFLEIADTELVANFIALEPDPKAAKHLKNISGIEIRQTVLDHDFDDRKYDLICLNKVLEHVKNPNQLLAKINTKLSDRGGIFYVEVPHIKTIGNRPITDNILGALHKNLYCVNSLSNALALNNFDVLEAGFVSEPSGKLTCFAFATASIDFWVQ